MRNTLKYAAAPLALAVATLTGCTTMDSNGEMAMVDNARYEMADGQPDYSNVPAATGYFATRSDLPLHAPNFTKISDGDYAPAFDQAMKIHTAEVAAIVDNPAPPSFSNTIAALENSGQMLGRVATVFFALTGANTNDTLIALQAQYGPKLSAHSDEITLNPELFARVKAVYDNRSAMSMTVEDATLLEETYKQMVHAGAELSPAQKEQVVAINTQLSQLTTEFSQKVRKATVDNALIVDDAAALAGLSDADIQSAAELAKEKGADGRYAIALQNTTQHPLLPALENRETREKLFKLSRDRAVMGDDNDTRLLLARIATLRAQKAELFGEPDWASYTMYDRMAKTPRHRTRLHGADGARTCRPRSAARLRCSMRRSKPTAAISKCSRGTGIAMPSRFARRATTSTRAR